VPLPVAHSAAGLASYLLFRDGPRPRISLRKELSLALVAVITANLPDLDFLPGLIIDQPARFHHGPSHSLLVGAITGALVYLVTGPFFTEISRKKLLLIFLMAGISHTVLDFLAVDTSVPYGVPLFWPFSDMYYISAVPVFLDVTRVDDSNQLFFATLFNFHNVMNFFMELLLSTAVVTAILARKDRVPSTRFWTFSAVSALCVLLFVIARLAAV
jgi:inner membrane protein